jgi:ABC-type transport system involved in multi-copper enzyme maturation permease subunit
VNGTVALLRHSVRRQRVLLSAACALLFLFQILLILVGRGFETTGGFAQLENLIPDVVRQWVDLPALSFRGMVSFAYSHPVVLLFLMAMALAIGTEPAGEIESKFTDLLLARPLARASVINRSLLVLLAATVAAVGSMLLGTWGGLLLFAPRTVPWPAPRVILSLAANLSLIVTAWGAIALAIASVAKRRAAAAGATGLLVLGMFILDAVGRLWTPLRDVARISPFHYFSPFPLIAGAPLPGQDIAVLGAIALTGFAVAHVAYARRDL